MKLKSLAALMMAGVMVLGLCACNSTTPDTSGSDSTPVSITTTESWDFSTGFYPAMSPATSNGTYGFTYYARNCYDTLVVRENGEFKAGLAETWDISDDGLTYTFHLKEGVKFSDGADLNAEAVKTSLEAAFSNLGAYIASFGKIGTLTESIEVVDEHTVAIHLTTPYYGVLNDLAMCNPMGIVSPNAFNEDLTTKEELLTQTMGTGPYMYAGDGDGTSYTFVRNPNYWGEQPDVDEFTVKVIADPDAAILALRNGEVDLLAGTSRLSFAGYTELSSADGIGTVLDDSISNSRFIGFNTQEAPFNDAAVRQAVAYAIDKETISDSVFSGLETASEQLLDTSLPYCDVEATTYSYNADKAKELLESAGWVDSDGDGIREKDGAKLSVTLDYITNQGTMDDAALVIAQELGEVGFEVTPRGSDNMTWFTQVSTDFDFSLHTTYGGYYDPFLTMTNMNPEMMSDPILWQVALTMENGTDTIKELDSTADLDRVQEIYNEVLTFTADQAVLVPFTSAHQYAAFNSDKIESFSFGSDQLFIEIANVKAKLTVANTQNTLDGRCANGFDISNGGLSGGSLDDAERHGYVRCVDVAEHLGVKKPSVSRAVKELSKSGHLVKNADGTLSLTELGLQFAEQIYEKHQFFTRQLIEAGVPQDIAAQDACKLEHVISETSYKKLREAAWPSSREVIPSDE